MTYSTRFSGASAAHSFWYAFATARASSTSFCVPFGKRPRTMDVLDGATTSNVVSLARSSPSMIMGYDFPYSLWIASSASSNRPCMASISSGVEV